jgi:hypothetical protein
VKLFFVPPNNCNRIPFLISSCPKILGAGTIESIQSNDLKEDIPIAFDNNS